MTMIAVMVFVHGSSHSLLEAPLMPRLTTLYALSC